MATPLKTHSRIKLVQNFDDLVSTPFGNGINALCWPRTLAGDFGAVARQIPPGEDIVNLDDDALRALALNPGGKIAVEILLQDLDLLRSRGLAPVLNCIRSYPRDEDGAPVPTDVYSFHADSATVETDTYLCTYFGAPSEGIPNEESVRRVEVPDTRADLLKLFGGEDNAEFAEFLHDHCYDLHYAAKPLAQPYSFGLGNLWRIAVEYPGSRVPPCVHRAPRTVEGSEPRLLLIS